MSKAFKEWSGEEIQAVATCLADDLRNAGPRFSIEFTPLSPSAKVITSVPPSDAPFEPTGPESGGLFIEDWTEDQLPEDTKSLMGFMHGALGEPADTAIALKVDRVAVMSLEFWSGLDHLEHLAGLVDQVQDVVMESMHERWPTCPAHDHELVPRPGDEWVEWKCPDSGETIARFGRLAERLP